MSVELPRSFSYRLAPEMNSGKRAALEAMHQEWQRTLPLAFDWHWQPFLNGGLLPFNLPRSGPQSTFPATALVTSQKDLMAVAIKGQAKGWASNLKRRVARSVMRDEMLAVQPALRRELLWINAMHAWLLPYRDQVELLAAQPSKSDMLTQVSLPASRIMRKLVRRYIELHRLPDPMQLPLQVNQLSAVWANAKDTRSAWAGHWLRVSTLKRGKKVELPVMGNPFAESCKGRRALTFNLSPLQDGWFVTSTKYVEPAHWDEHRVDVLALDLGLRNLLASSEGDLLGVGFLDALRRYDEQLLRIQQGLQGAGIRRLSECRRYRLFVQRLRGFLKTKVQTLLGELLERRRPKKVVIEDLLFAGQHGELSRRMNRLLRRFGQRYFTETLEHKSKELGFELVYVEAAYTSQTCSSCGFVHPGNRKGDNFKCISCGRQGHADVNAAKNQARRSAPGAHPQPTNRHAWRTRSLQAWAARLRATLLQDASGLPRHHRAVGCARAGLVALTKKQRSARGLTSVETTTLQGLLDGLSTVAALSDSTRYSG